MGNWLILFLTIGSLLFKGDLPVQGDYFYSSDSLGHLEIFYEVPRSSLIFTKEGEDFVARYECALWISPEKRGDFSFHQKIRKEVRCSNYEETKTEEPEAGRLFFSLPRNTIRCLLTFACLNSDLSATTQFFLTEKSEIFLQRGGNVTFRETLSYSDTLSLYLPPNPHITSYEITLKRKKNEIFRKVISAGALFSYPLINSSAIFNDTSGFYTLEITYQKEGKREKKEIPIFINVSLFLSDREWQRKVSLLFPITTDEELRRLKFTQKEERQSAWQDFWEKQEISEEEYFSRVDYCLKNFSIGDKGLASDRAKIYLKYGQPDTIEEYPYETGRKPYIIWRYYNLGLVFTFVDLKGIGEYVLVK